MTDLKRSETDQEINAGVDGFNKYGYDSNGFNRDGIEAGLVMKALMSVDAGG